MIRRLAVVAALLSGACCPVPWHRTVLDAPGSNVRVIDAAGNAVPGATVTVRRYNLGPPPRRQTGLWTATTSSNGAASFSQSSTGEWVMPLMMHGVPQWAWEVCVAAPGKDPVVATLLVQRAWSRPSDDAAAAKNVTVQLGDGQGAPCGTTYFMETYPTSVTGNDHRYEDSL